MKIRRSIPGASQSEIDEYESFASDIYYLVSKCVTYSQYERIDGEDHIQFRYDPVHIFQGRCEIDIASVIVSFLIPKNTGLCLEIGTLVVYDSTTPHTDQDISDQCRDINTRNIDDCILCDLSRVFDKKGQCFDDLIINGIEYDRVVAISPALPTLSLPYTQIEVTTSEPAVVWVQSIGPYPNKYLRDEYTVYSENPCLGDSPIMKIRYGRIIVNENGEYR